MGPRASHICQSPVRERPSCFYTPKSQPCPRGLATAGSVLPLGVKAMRLVTQALRATGPSNCPAGRGWQAAQRVGQLRILCPGVPVSLWALILLTDQSWDSPHLSPEPGTYISSFAHLKALLWEEGGQRHRSSLEAHFRCHEASWDGNIFLGVQGK